MRPLTMILPAVEDKLERIGRQIEANATNSVKAQRTAGKSRKRHREKLDEKMETVGVPE